MHAKCGNIENAYHLFHSIPQRDSVSWNSIITRYAEHGYGKEFVQLFKQMLQIGIDLDHITFISVLSMWSHTGLVNEGHEYFNSMSQDYNLVLGIEHYACIIDILGWACLLNETEDYINTMPYEPNAGIWGAFLSSCRIHGNMELAIRVAGFYVLLPNIYATVCVAFKYLCLWIVCVAFKYLFHCGKVGRCRKGEKNDER